MQSGSQKKRFQDMKKTLQQKNYEIIKSLGKGAFGQVMLARNKKDQLYAVKIINKSLIKKKPFLQKYINQEISIMKQLNHQNIVRYSQEFRTADFIVIVMQYCQQGNLLTYQAKLPGKTFPLKQAVKIIVEVMKGLRCIHQKNFIHRDIKSENVLLKKIFKDKDSYDIGYKIADFGFARSIGSAGAKTHCGTQKYMAPQIISNSYYGISVDIWAVGVLFYFMLFAQYPFKGHDMKAQITRRCSHPTFSLQATVSKKQKLKDISNDVEDFFKKIFVVDPKKRMQFSDLKDHPLFIEYSSQFKQSNAFYKNYQKKQQYVKDQVQANQYGFQNQMTPQDQSRATLIKKKQISSLSKHLQKQLQEIFYEIEKIEYLKECAIQFYDSYTSYLRYQVRLAAKFYLLKAYLFYCDPLLNCLINNQMPQGLSQVGLSESKWIQCTKTNQYKKNVNKLSEQNMKVHILFQDTFNQIAPIIDQIPIKNFQIGYKLSITEKTFDQLKFAYRSTTSYIFKIIHENKKIDPHMRNKIKMRLFCCHMINRIFNRKQVKDHFPAFINWLIKKKYQYLHTFDLTYFKKWIYEQSQENLQKNISLLHKTFF